jgi:hypothetical protein
MKTYEENLLRRSWKLLNPRLLGITKRFEKMKAQFEKIFLYLPVEHLCSGSG